MKRSLWCILAAAAIASSLPGSAFAQPTGEAPQLAARVAAGELPPVAERMPVNPEVIDYGEVGTYGGTLRFGLRTPTDDIRTIGRATQGVRLMDLDGGDKVVSVALVDKVEEPPKDDEAPKDEEPQPPSEPDAQ